MCWRESSRLFNRYLQRFRRLHAHKIQYIRVIESHKDGYPHIHILLQFSYACIRVEGGKYFTKLLYKKWKALWIEGHTDYQKPKRQNGVIRYILKYLLKNQTKKTIYKKISPKAVQDAVPDRHDSSIPKKSGYALPVSKYGVKLCTWSRGFDWQPFLSSSHTKPCPNDCKLHSA